MESRAAAEEQFGSCHCVCESSTSCFMLSNCQRGSALEDTYKSCRGVPYCNMTGMHIQILHKNTSDLGDSGADARVPFVWWGSREWERTAVLRRRRRWWSRACTSLWRGFCVMSLLIFSHNFLCEKKKKLVFFFFLFACFLTSDKSSDVRDPSKCFPEGEIFTCKILRGWFCRQLCRGAKAFCVLVLAPPVQGHITLRYEFPVVREHLWSSLKCLYGRATVQHLKTLWLILP